MKNESYPSQGSDPTEPALQDLLATFGARFGAEIGAEIPGYPGFKVFGYTRNGIQIMLDPVHSHAATHLEDTPGLRGLLVEVLAQKDVDIYTEGDGNSMIFDMDLGRDVGVSYQVPTDETDEIVYAVRKNRDTYMRFTLSRPPEPTSLVTVVLKRETDDRYTLFSGWTGPLTPAIPGTKHATPESWGFWTTHALVGNPGNRRNIGNDGVPLAAS